MVAMLRDMLERRLEYARKDGERFFDAAQNARVVAERRALLPRDVLRLGGVLEPARHAHVRHAAVAARLLRPEAREGIVWEHNSHVGDAARDRDERPRRAQRRAAVPRRPSARARTSSASAPITAPWPRRRTGTSRCSACGCARAHEESYERLFHESGVPAFLLHLREPRRTAVREELLPPRLERAIGVVYRPETELASHYFYASLPRQFDELVWFDETRAVHPLGAGRPASGDVPETYPFGV